MKNYIDHIQPFIEGIIDLTKQNRIKWEKSGDQVYRCVDLDHNLSMEISKGNSFLANSVRLKLYSLNNLDFDYAPDVLQKYPEFDDRLSQLYECAEEENVKDVTDKFHTLFKSFQKKS